MAVAAHADAPPHPHPNPHPNPQDNTNADLAPGWHLQVISHEINTVSRHLLSKLKLLQRAEQACGIAKRYVCSMKEVGAKHTCRAHLLAATPGSAWLDAPTPACPASRP